MSYHSFSSVDFSEEKRCLRECGALSYNKIVFKCLLMCSWDSGVSFGVLGKGIMERTVERQSRQDLEDSWLDKCLKREGGRSWTQLSYLIEPYLAGCDWIPWEHMHLSLETAVLSFCSNPDTCLISPTQGSWLLPLESYMATWTISLVILNTIKFLKIICQKWNNSPYTVDVDGYKGSWIIARKKDQREKTWSWYDLGSYRLDSLSSTFLLFRGNCRGPKCPWNDHV